MSGIDLTFPMRVGEQDKLFGSVTNRDMRALVAMGHPVDARRIVLDEPIKALGVYPVQIKLTAGVMAEVKVWVVADRTAEPVVEEEPEEEPELSAAGAADEGDEFSEAETE